MNDESSAAPLAARAWRPRFLASRLGAALERVRETAWSGHDELRYAARVWVWVRWLVAAACLFVLVYHPESYPQRVQVAWAVGLVLLVASNGLVHHRLTTGRPVTRAWMMALNALDVALITVATAAAGGFSQFSQFLLYYPALAMFAVVFTSFTLNVVWVTVVACVYATVCLAVGDGLDLEAWNDKTLFGRIVIMYAVVLVVNLVLRFERTARREAVEREQALLEERIGLSQSIHDTTAQSAYMIGLGIDAAMKLAGESDERLRSTLEATSALSRSVIWELRRPIDASRIFEGRDLAPVLRSHAETFTRVTSVPASVTESGEEPRLPAETRSRLFSIAHNALTNAFRHARAGSVEVRLDFGPDTVTLSVSDDGVGLPEGYGERGRGFAGMRADAERMGGELVVESGGPGAGTTVRCTVPHARRN